jgi:aldose 1-epimerase
MATTPRRPLERVEPAAAIGRPCVQRVPFDVTALGDHVEAFVLTNARGMEVRFIPYGGIILSIRVPDRDGVLADVTLGHDNMNDYGRDDRYFGALIGRFANRIAGGRFVLDGREHVLACNDGLNHLHGGTRGFHDVMWEVESFSRGHSVGGVLRYTSPDGDEGYPGTVRAWVTYTLTGGNELVVDYAAETDRATPINLTQHAYFNLAGHDAGDVLSHELELNASRFTPVDEHLIPTGEMRCVHDTPFDFVKSRAVGDHIDAADEQLARGRGYDHNFVLDRAEHGVADGEPMFAARLREPSRGRVLEIYTTEPGIQLYSGNVLQGRPAGKGGYIYGRRGGLALEPQHFPDSPNQPAFPSTILRPGETYASRTIYRFDVDSLPA